MVLHTNNLVFKKTFMNLLPIDCTKNDPLKFFAKIFRVDEMLIWWESLFLLTKILSRKKNEKVHFLLRYIPSWTGVISIYYIKQNHPHYNIYSLALHYKFAFTVSYLTFRLQIFTYLRNVVMYPIRNFFGLNIFRLIIYL